MKKLLFNYILYFSCLLFICFIGISNVFAYDPSQYYVAGDVSSKLQQLVSTNYGSSPFNNPINSGYAFGEVLQVDNIVSNFSFQANKVYQLEVHLAHQKFVNSNVYTVTGLNGETCLISYENSIMNNDAYPRWAFQCPHSTNTITVTISNSSGNYLWSGTNIFDWVSSTVWASDSLSFDTSDTDNIINNQNKNTQDIINNQNQNTQDIINSNQVCSIIDKSSIKDNNVAIYSDGASYSTNNYGVTDYINVYNGKVYKLIDNITSTYMCFYNINKVKLSCIRQDSITSNNEITLPNNTYYMRFSIDYYDNKPQFKLCKNGNNALNDSINDLDDTLNDDDVGDATSEASDFFSDFNTNTFGLTSIITAPLNLIQSLTSSTCSQLELPLPYLDNKKLILPCMTTIYSTYFGSFFTMYQTITYGIIAYWVCVRIFNQVKDFKNPEHDEIEVVDL